MSTAVSAEITSGNNLEKENLAAVISDVEDYMRCSDMSLLRNVKDENYLIKLLLLGVSGGKEEDIKNPSLIFDQLHSQGTRQVCQYQFKRYAH